MKQRLVPVLSAGALLLAVIIALLLTDSENTITLDGADPAVSGAEPAPGQAEDSPRSTADTISPGILSTSRPTPAEPPVTDPTSAFDSTDFRTVSLSNLPPEATDTWQRIESDGPFPYNQDGSTFQNREQLLPVKSRGFYREYTIRTPGEDDRGARRFVVGEDGDVYYTADHYDSFVRVDVDR